MAHLLLIDDDSVLIPEQVRQAFPAPRYRVEVAGTGAEGIECVSAGPPEVILLDLRLPDQSGLEVYQQIRKVDARIPVIFVTLAKTADAAIEAMKQGAYDLKQSLLQASGTILLTAFLPELSGKPAEPMVSFIGI